MRFLITAVFLLISFSLANAADMNIYSCPGSYKTVRVGDTMDTVRTACGDPSTINTKQQQVVTPVKTIQWTYTLGLVQGKNIAVVLPTLTVVFNDNKVSSISKTGFPVSTSGYCAINGVINIGDPMEKVLLTCGQPNFTNTSESGITTNKTLTEWTYNHGLYQPQIIVTFDENGTVTGIASGKLGS